MICTFTILVSILIPTIYICLLHLVTVECRIAEIISGKALDTEREEPEMLAGFRQMESPITDMDSVSERLPHDVSPR